MRSHLNTMGEGLLSCSAPTPELLYRPSPRITPVAELRAEHLPPAVDAGHDGSKRSARQGGDVGVGIALDVCQIYDGLELGRKFAERAHDRGLADAFEGPRLCRA